MKAKFLFVFLFLILSFSIVSSVDINVKKEVKLGENFVVKVSGSFYTQPTTSDIKFYRDGIKTSFGIVKLEKIEDEYYFFLEIPLEKMPGNYSIVFEDVKYNSGRNVVTGDISADFVILNKTAPFSISPPLLITSEDYEVQVQNLMDSKITINLEKSSKALDILESTGETVESGGFLDTLFKIFNSGNETENTTTQPGSIVTEEPTSGATISLLSGEKKTLFEKAPTKSGFQMLNLYYGGEAYGVLVYSKEGKPEIQIDEDNKTVVVPDNKEEITKETKEEKVQEVKKEAEAVLEEKGLDKEDYVITENGTILDKKTNQELDRNLKTCSESNGTTCVEGEKCNGVKDIVFGAECCFGTCEIVQKSSTGKVIGWFIIAIIAIFATWFFKQKYKKVGPKKIDILAASKPKK